LSPSLSYQENIPILTFSQIHVHIKFSQYWVMVKVLWSQGLVEWIC